jgi:hypothetical protein
MGIDVYLKWRRQTNEEVNAQITGFSAAHGHTGYLREAYHGEPYATRVLISEDWSRQPDEGFSIPAKTLAKRLADAQAAARERARHLYKQEDDPPMVKSLADFVALAAQKEQETGEPCLVVVSY